MNRALAIVMEASTRPPTRDRPHVPRQERRRRDTDRVAKTTAAASQLVER